jgi:hypothetical protein
MTNWAAAARPPGAMRSSAEATGIHSMSTRGALQFVFSAGMFHALPIWFDEDQAEPWSRGSAATWLDPIKPAIFIHCGKRD